MAHYYTPIEEKAPANAATFNAPLEELDAKMSEQQEFIEELGADSGIQERQIEDLQERMTTAEGSIEDLAESGLAMDERITALEEDPGYALPPATAETLGGVKIGDGLDVDADGVISADIPEKTYFVECTSAQNAQYKELTITDFPEIIPDGCILDVLFINGSNFGKDSTGSRVYLTINEGTPVRVDKSMPFVPQNGMYRFIYSETTGFWHLNNSAYSYYAYRLQNARKIGGIPFDGTADIAPYVVCSTAAATAAKAITVTPAPTVGEAFVVYVRFENGNSASGATLSCNSGTAYSIDLPEDLPAGAIVCCVFDGTEWTLLYDKSGTVGPEYHFATSNTAASTAEKAVTIAGVTEYTDGMILDLYLSQGHTYTGLSKININNLGAITTNMVVPYCTSACVVRFIYSEIDNKFYMPSVARAKYADNIQFYGFYNLKLDGSRLSFANEYNTRMIVTDSVASAGAKSITQAGYNILSDAKATSGSWAFVRFTNGNTSRSISLSYNSSYQRIYRSDGSTEMPDIPAGGYIKIVYDGVNYRWVLFDEDYDTTISITSETDSALDALTVNKDYVINLSGEKSRLKNLYVPNVAHEQYWYTRPASVTAGSNATPVVKYRVRLYGGSDWDGWSSWTTLAL